MSNIDSISRERKKNQLRQQMVGNRSINGGMEPEEDSEEVIWQALRRLNRRRVAVIGGIVLLLFLALFGFYQYQKRYQFTDYKVTWEISMPEGSLVGYEYFGNNVLKYSKDGASYIDNQGNTVWTQSYEMKAPVAAAKGDYIAIADQRGNDIYIYGKEGPLGTATTLLPISKITISGNGTVAVIMEEATASYIYFFSREGNLVDVKIKDVMGSNGYPVDISLAKDGTQLICSYVHLENGEMKSRVVFYDFSEIGKNIPTRIVGGFDESFNGKIVSRVRYLSEPYSCAFTGDSLTFFSSKNLASPELIKQIPVEEEIQSIFYSEDYAGIIVKTNKGENPNRMDIYRKNGELFLSREFDYEYVKADLDGDLIFLYNEESCRVYSISGVEKLSASFDFTVSKIRKGRFPNTLIITGPGEMKEIKMQ